MVIVNLTCLMEDTVSLCHQYWPDADRQLYHIYEAGSLLSMLFVTSVVSNM